MPGNILLVDDEEQLRKLLSRIISLEGFNVQEAATLKQAGSILQKTDIDILLCDVKLPDGSGVDFVKEAKQKKPLTEIILLTAYGNIPDGVRAIKNGAFDYITKGNDNDRIILLLHQALAKARMNQSNAVKIKDKGSYDFADIIGHSSAITEATRLAKKISPTDNNVLLLGETGTGKEVFANAIHTGSKRSASPFVAINCSAFTKDLLEGELFGHKAGAYTGAAKDKKGLVELANKGTLFLDEVGEMNLELQAKILRLIENRAFIKLGDEKTTEVDIRIIAATNRNLLQAIQEGSFREDLYYRLNVFTITLPPLRERTEDIPALVTFLLSKENNGERAWQIQPAALTMLQAYAFRGNIRELKNVIARAIVLADNFVVTPQDLPYEIQQSNSDPLAELSLAAIEKNHIGKVLHRTKGNKTKTAELLGIGLTTLYRKLEEYNIPK